MTISFFELASIRLKKHTCLEEDTFDFIFDFVFLFSLWNIKHFSFQPTFLKL
jgi:hypothetical protein